MLDWYKERNEEVKHAFDELCSKNAKITFGMIQKDLANSCAQAIIKAIKEEMGGCLFSILIDESRDISIKKQMAIVVRFVKKKGSHRKIFGYQACQGYNIGIIEESITCSVK
jgi:hypothetical protein